MGRWRENGGGGLLRWTKISDYIPHRAQNWSTKSVCNWKISRAPSVNPTLARTVVIGSIRCHSYQESNWVNKNLALGNNPTTMKSACCIFSRIGGGRKEMHWKTFLDFFHPLLYANNIKQETNYLAGLQFKCLDLKYPFLLMVSYSPSSRLPKWVDYDPRPLGTVCTMEWRQGFTEPCKELGITSHENSPLLL